MPSIIDYDIVLARMESMRFKCHYFNSGAFGFIDNATRTLAWIGPPDDTITAAARPLVRGIAPPYAANLAGLATRAWQENIGAAAWVMPTSHWAYELIHGGRDRLAALIEEMHLDPRLLEARSNAAALEFSAFEAGLFKHFVGHLLEILDASDFLLTFPGWPILCTLHHHKQLWWTSSDEQFMGVIDALIPIGVNLGQSGST